jgi:hypothetical protein
MVTRQMSTEHPGGEAVDEFYGQFSTYVDGFLVRRSALSASLFPEKPAQMYYGYSWAEQAVPEITDFLARRAGAAELGGRFRAMRSPGNALSLSGGIWGYLMGTLGRELTGLPWSTATAEQVLGYWQGVFASYTALCDPPSRPPDRGQDYLRFAVLGDAEASSLAEQIVPSAGEAARACLAVCANYAWLLECESRQGTFSHGLYAGKDGARLLVREFVDLSGRRYPWVEGPPELPAQPVAIILALREVDASFDVFGVPAVEPPSYEDHITGVAVVTDAGVEPEPELWLQRCTGAATVAHRSLFRTIVGWEARDRFLAGGRSYGRMWADVLELAGASPDEIDALVFDSLDRFAEEHLEEHLTRDGPAPIWPWIAQADRATVFEPVLAVLRRLT